MELGNSDRVCDGGVGHDAHQPVEAQAMVKRGRPRGSKNGCGKRSRKRADMAASVLASLSETKKEVNDGVGVKTKSETNEVALELLVAFCRYLRCRVVTMNIDVLEKMMTDFFVHDQDTTLQEFVLLGVNLVTILPIDVQDEKQREEAAEALAVNAGVRTVRASMQVRARAVEHACSFFTMLGQRVDTRRIGLLQTLFCEFTLHRDTELQQFVACASCAVSILPCAMDYVTQLSATPVARSVETTSVLASTVSTGPPISPHGQKRKQRSTTDERPASDPKRQPSSSSLTYDAAKLIESGVAGIDEEQIVLPSFFKVSDIAVLKEEVMARMLAYEAREPWKVAYGNMPLPFKEEDAPELADKLRRFWIDNGRAIWERHFWAPLSKFHATFELRKQRQRMVVNQFNQIIELAYRRFGAEFFVRLDKEPHVGWWYRRPLMEVVLLRLVVGKQCWEILDATVDRTHPFRKLSLPLRRLAHLQRPHIGWSRAMWSKSWGNYENVIREMKEITSREEQSK